MTIDAIPSRRIGSLETSAMGLGCMGMSTAYGRGDRAAGTATIHAAIDRGVTLFDTADVYGRGGNERLVGAAIKDRRDRVVLATKFGLLANRLTGVPNGIDARPERARRCIDECLQRLGVDHVDLWYLHRVDPAVPIEDTVGAMAEAVDAGKVRELGLSEANPDMIRRAARVHKIAALQTEWSIFSRDIEDGPLEAAREVGAAIVPYSPLGRGMLTGAASASTRLALLDFRRTLPRWRGAHLDANIAAVAKIGGLAGKLGLTSAQLALAWLIARGKDVVPIPGTTHIDRLEENLGALTVEIPADLLTQLDAIRASGDRYGARRSWDARQE